MKRQLTLKEILYDMDFSSMDENLISPQIPGYDELYWSIKRSLEIKQEGFNLYLIDDFSKDKLNNIKEYIKNIYEDKEAPKDICYVTYEDEKRPKAIKVSNGIGNILKNMIQEIQDFYQEILYKFYNNATIKEKEDLTEELQDKRSQFVSLMIDKSKEKGFDVKYSQGGFIFIPLKEGEAMSEKEYDGLEHMSKKEILGSVTELKKEAEDIIMKLVEMEKESIEKLKKVLLKYLNENVEEKKKQWVESLKRDDTAIEYIEFLIQKFQRDILDLYSASYESDEEKINELLYGCGINVIVDNSENKYPPVVFEESPNISNLMGSIEYESQNGNYVTDITLITAGSILRANEGCIIIRLEDLLNNPGSYYYLKKAFLNNKVDFDFNKVYLELLWLNGLKPEPIEINTKLIIIGDLYSYDVLYEYDKDFKRIFGIKEEYNPLISVDGDNTQYLISTINHVIFENKLNPINKEAIKEIGRYLSKKAENKHKFYFNTDELNKILVLANSLSKYEKKPLINEEHIIKAAYPKENIEKEVFDMYKEGKIILNVKGDEIGSVNGLSVWGTSYYSFGRPIRITCICSKGEGNVLDGHKDNDLSGNIHRKSVSILKAYLSNRVSPYEKLPVNFHLSFEQVYGKLDGDSASVAEVICMLSSLSKTPIKQNIAVTGSLNQLGEVQPIGGINEKIEGFYKVCSILDDIDNKGVLIPESNISDLVLSKEVEEAIIEGRFSLYSMKNIDDAVEILFHKKALEDMLKNIKKEINKYNIEINDK